MIVSWQPSGPVSANVAVVWPTDTDKVLPCHLSRKFAAVQPGGSHGLKVIWPFRTRNPPNPQTIACQVPPAEAMWMPSAVLPWIVGQVDECCPAEVLDGAARVADLDADDGVDRGAERRLVQRQRLVVVAVGALDVTAELVGEHVGQRHHVGLLDQVDAGEVVVVVARRVHRHVVAVVRDREGFQPEVPVELLDHSVVVPRGQADLLGPGEPVFDLIAREPDPFGQDGQFPGVADCETGIDVRGLLQVPPHQVVGIGAVVDMLVELVGADHPAQ
jgi:hypothetical protein